MDDDELRQRLRAMPEPTTTIDVDAVVADARRRRRPKVIGTGVAVGAACLAFLAPVVVPGLLGPDPVTSSLQEAGVAEQGDSGGEPAAPAPAATDGAEPDASTLQSGGVDVAGPPPTGCSATPAGSTVPGLAIAFEADPVAGSATVLLSNGGSERLTVRVGGVGEAILGDDGAVLAAPSIAAASYADPLLLIEPGETERIQVAVTPALDCEGGSSTALPDGQVVPVIGLALGASGDEMVSVLGTPTAP